MGKNNKMRYATFRLLLMSGIVCCSWRETGWVASLYYVWELWYHFWYWHSIAFLLEKYYQNMIVKEATKFSCILVTAPDDFCHYQGGSSASTAWLVWSEWVREGGRDGGGVYLYWAECGWNTTFDWNQCCQNVNVRIGRVFFTLLW